MTRPLRMALRFLAIVAATAVAHAPPSRTQSPYVSALSDLAASPILAANPHCHGTCEFVAPAYTCLNESSGTRCRKSSTSGCSTITC